MISSIPIEVIQNRSLSLLESIVRFLKEKERMNFHDIGLLLNRDERNIWTVYSRAKEKVVCSPNKEDVIDTPRDKISSENRPLFSIYGGERWETK